MKKTFIYALAMVTCTGTAMALADNNSGNNNGNNGSNNNGGNYKDHPHGPPIEALKACEGKTAGDKVQFVTRNGRTINGTCKLIAVPERLMGEGGGQQGGQNNQGTQGTKQ